MNFITPGILITSLDDSIVEDSQGLDVSHISDSICHFPITIGLFRNFKNFKMDFRYSNW